MVVSNMDMPSLKALSELEFQVDQSHPVIKTEYQVQAQGDTEGNASSSQTVSANNVFDDVNPGVTSAVSSSVTEADTTISNDRRSLSSYLDRFVKISEFTIALNEPFQVRTIAPWNLYLQNDAIKRKIENFAWVRGMLEVKILLNSTSFVYGMYAASYEPLPDLVGDSYTSGDGVNARVPLSQRASACGVTLRPAVREAGTMVLPFFYNREFLSVTDTNDASRMGSIDIFQIVPFSSAISGTTTDVEVSVMARMVPCRGDNGVQLVGNTLSSPFTTSVFELQGLVSEVLGTSEELQTEAEEMGLKQDGVVSGPLTALANHAGDADGIPIISPLAHVGGTVVKGVAALASLFGFTDPPVVGPVQPFKDLPYGALSNSRQSVPSDVLMLDPTGSLTLDPASVGLTGVDQMSIPYIVQRASFLTSQVWATSDVAEADLFTANVTPQLCVRDAGVNQDTIWDTPISGMSRAFKYWRGGMVFRISLVKSPYHTGRLLVSYDPVGQDLGTAATTMPETNTVILDVEQESEVCIHVPWKNQLGFLENEAAIDENWVGKGAAATLTCDPAYCNGQLTVRVLNALGSSDSTANAHIVVQVYGAGDLEFENPRDIVPHLSTYEVQASVPARELKTIHIDESAARDRRRNLQYFGEKIRSVRDLLRRSSLVEARYFDATNPAAAQNAIYAHLFQNYPQEYGFDPNGLSTALGNVSGVNEPANLVPLNPFTYFASWFVGMRGQMHHAFLNASDEFQTMFRAKRLVDSTTTTSADFSTEEFLGTDANKFALSSITVGAGSAGQSLLNEKTQSGMQVVVPYMNNYKFIGTSKLSRTKGSTDDGSRNQRFEVSRLVYRTTANQLKNGMYHYASIGQDFSFFYFLSVPRKYEYTIGAVP